MLTPKPTANGSTSRGQQANGARGAQGGRGQNGANGRPSLLQAGGFSAIVLDMASIAPEYASRVPLATWFRYRAAAERNQASILLLTQHTCAKSSAGLVLRLQSGHALQEEMTVFTGIEYRVEVARERFAAVPANVVPLRKPPQGERNASWHSRTTWAGR